mmetsp:Transcript_49390/g.88819  ORF Transcript_49390/g.88819 Transcript_49390/m.88819 type:complete len:385 (-) Transcript_49390:2322-3476(-)
MRLKLYADGTHPQAAHLRQGNQHIQQLSHFGIVCNHDGLLAHGTTGYRSHVHLGFGEADNSGDTLAQAANAEVANTKVAGDHLEHDVVVHLGRCLWTVGDTQLPALPRQQGAQSSVASAVQDGHRTSFGVQLISRLFFEYICGHVLDGQVRRQPHEGEALLQLRLVVYGEPANHRRAHEAASEGQHGRLKFHTVGGEIPHKCRVHWQHLISTYNAHRNPESTLNARTAGVPALRIPAQEVLLRTKLHLDRLLFVALNVSKRRVQLQLVGNLGGLLDLDLHRDRLPVADDDALAEGVAVDTGSQVVLLLVHKDRHVEARAAHQNPLLLFKVGIPRCPVGNGQAEHRGKGANRLGCKVEGDLGGAVLLELALLRPPVDHPQEVTVA